MSPRIDADVVRQAAQGRWHHILAGLGIVVPSHPRKHGPCPTCGGKDRFKFDDRDGFGSWYCNQCQPHAGDGVRLVMNARALRFPDALAAVGGVLGLDLSQSAKPRPPLPPLPAPIDRCALAFRCELGALDRRLRAAKIQDAARHLDITALSNDELDRAIALVMTSYEDVARADLFEALADNLRMRAFIERTANERRHLST